MVSGLIHNYHQEELSKNCFSGSARDLEEKKLESNSSQDSLPFIQQEKRIMNQTLLHSYP